MSEDGSRMADTDLRPVVATSGQGNTGLYVFAAVLLAGGFGVYSALGAGREASGVAVTAPPAPDGSRISSPPPLVLPRIAAEPMGGMDLAEVPDEPRVPRVTATRPVSPEPRSQAPSQDTAPMMPPVQEPPFAVLAAGPRVLYNQPPSPLLLPEPPAASPGSPGGTERVQARRLERPDLTVPQGTVIPAVLETAFDSTRPGSARALVQRDVYGFDGSRVLIPRGSRLYGTSQGGLVQGQRRAEIRWTRLIRPDGVTVALDSPVADPLGRAGVTGRVDSRFLARFGGAILQSFLDLGVGVATRAATDGVIVALPGSTQNVAGTATQDIQPVLRVDQGTSVSVFVARDLDFSSVE